EAHACLALLNRVTGEDHNFFEPVAGPALPDVSLGTLAGVVQDGRLPQRVVQAAAPGRRGTDSRIALRQQVEEIIDTGLGGQTDVIVFTPRARRTLEFAQREALRTGNGQVGAEHLLAGLIRGGEGVAAQVLARIGRGSRQEPGLVVDVTP